MGQRKLQSSGICEPLLCFTSALWCVAKLEGFASTVPHMQHTSFTVTFSFAMIVTLCEATGFLQNWQRDSSFAANRSARSCLPR